MFASGVSFPNLRQLTLISADLGHSLRHFAASNLLQHLNLSYNPSLTHSHLIELFQSCPQLEILELAGCESLGDDTIKLIAQSFPQLRELNISQLNSCCDVSPLGVLRDLESLSARSCRNIGTSTLRKALTDCRKLRQVGLYDHPGIDSLLQDEAFRHMELNHAKSVGVSQFSARRGSQQGASLSLSTSDCSPSSNHYGSSFAQRVHSTFR